MKSLCPRVSFLLLITLVLTSFLYSEAQKCRPNGRMRGKKAPSEQCNKENDSDYKTLLRIFFVPFYKTPLLFPTTLIISLHTCPYLLYIFFFNQQ
ncbi:transmembrane protein, putative [Medicago truncatula]|uniref:Transmembrane protein, putative n=1 Tax=Medicago truncatula TaxID=3880 RepID=G7L3L1_MEDTR|nr:transmembrane protein, putative [Medicago truncatula]